MQEKLEEAGIDYQKVLAAQRKSLVSEDLQLPIIGLID